MTATTALATLPSQRRQRRAAVYIRMSTDHQRYSIAQQSHELDVRATRLLTGDDADMTLTFGRHETRRWFNTFCITRACGQGTLIVTTHQIRIWILVSQPLGPESCEVSSSCTAGIS